MSIKKLLADDEYVQLYRLILFHKKLNGGDGLEDDEYEEYEELRNTLQHIIPT